MTAGTATARRELAHGPALEGAIARGVLLLAAAGGGLIAFPVERRLEYAPVQSLQAVPDLWGFAALMTVWMATLLLLLWLAESLWSATALVACFAAVYFGFWTLHWPYGAFEDWGKMQGAQVIVASGHVQPYVQHYWEWPGLSLLGAAASLLAGVDLAALRLPLVLLEQVALTLALLALALRLLPSPRDAALAVILAIVGGPWSLRFHFHPMFMALLLLVTFVLLSLRYMERREVRVGAFLALVLIILATVVTHFVTSVLLAFLLLAWRVGQRLPRTPLAQRVPVAWLAALLVVAWQLYWAVPLFDESVRQARETVRATLSGEVGAFLSYGRAVGANNLDGFPLWATLTRWGWALLLPVVGVLCALLVVLRGRALPVPVRALALAVLGTAAAVAMATVVSPGGQQFHRFLLYAPLLAAPLLMVCLRRHLANAGPLLVSALLLLAVVPTFLAHSNLVSSDSYYEEQVAAGRFLARSLDDGGSGVSLYSGGAAFVGRYFAPFIYLDTGPMLDQGPTSNTEDSVRGAYGRMVAAFLAEGERARPAIFWVDPWPRAYYHLWFGPQGAVYVLQPLDGLSTSPRIYDNGLVVLWATSLPPTAVTLP
jgi:hypothetical protein